MANFKPKGLKSQKIPGAKPPGRVPHIPAPKAKFGQAQRRIYTKNALNEDPMAFGNISYGQTGLTGES